MVGVAEAVIVGVGATGVAVAVGPKVAVRVAVAEGPVVAVGVGVCVGVEVGVWVGVGLIELP